VTAFAVELHDAWLAPAGVELSTPRDPELRGSHITVDHPAFREMTAALWDEDVIPDFRAPQGIRIGLSPLSTSFTELYRYGSHPRTAGIGTFRAAPEPVVSTRLAACR
jgi:kynureninase